MIVNTLSVLASLLSTVSIIMAVKNKKTVESLINELQRDDKK